MKEPTSASCCATHHAKHHPHTKNIFNLPGLNKFIKTRALKNVNEKEDRGRVGVDYRRKNKEDGAAESRWWRWSLRLRVEVVVG